MLSLINLPNGREEKPAIAHIYKQFRFQYLREHQLPKRQITRGFQRRKETLPFTDELDLTKNAETNHEKSPEPEPEIESGLEPGTFGMSRPKMEKSFKPVPEEQRVIHERDTAALPLLSTFCPVIAQSSFKKGWMQVEMINWGVTLKSRHTVKSEMFGSRKISGTLSCPHSLE
ncbi:hypothetical protein LOY97_006065 [Ophidiomyces ophidiicola]|uniref:uncharacterized protein n=1 Tax=Ophidiomyces ophidiicola TaxID=1387563 RepID=UPI0020C4470A|nr:uncharacterized protein LOZ57_006159 [Ophidiomyces ophidiicola]KAI1939199.1 hypothetical protein LOZ57_006159 [Ophidiomyces ophidiicola]KAI2058079.1 hypothetical protein LOZ43_002729 [Ophidiomyces ophidiicola]KAI2086778.1 hypothetical protein LOZ36_003111 [Ophidiomyces ophidiicola]KAI2139715.1 hypothetical protein LOZ28_003139 [Ophidiomyces ophidiicola]KAI2443824.1 hypothetical protein LOZ08_002238 [Ophidiomyces ophidiicola]